MKIVWAILSGGLTAAVLDIIYAFLVYGPLSYGLSPEQVLQSVAAGWIGREAAGAGGVETALLGAGTHVLIATAMAGVYVLLSTRLKSLTQHAVQSGLAYGLVLYGVMHYVVVPLSASATGEFASGADAVARLSEAFGAVRGGGGEDYPWMIWGAIFTHTVLVGLPISLMARRFLHQQT